MIHQKLESGPACYRPWFPSFLNYYCYHLDRLVIVSFLPSFIHRPPMSVRTIQNSKVDSTPLEFHHHFVFVSN